MQEKVEKNFQFHRCPHWKLLRKILPILTKVLVIGSQCVNKLSKELRYDQDQSFPTPPNSIYWKTGMKFIPC